MQTRTAGPSLAGPCEIRDIKLSIGSVLTVIHRVHFQAYCFNEKFFHLQENLEVQESPEGPAIRRGNISNIVIILKTKCFQNDLNRYSLSPLQALWDP